MLQTDFTLFPEISTSRLQLRKLVPEDAAAILHLRSNELVMRFIDKERAENMEDALKFINRINLSLETNEGITWAICLKEYPEILIGTIGYWRIIKEHHRAEIGYMLDPAHWTKGIMKEALLKVISFGFKDIQLHSIEAHINPGNTASAALLTSTGFVKEAHFKEDFLFNGSFRDTAIYSRLQ